MKSHKEVVIVGAQWGDEGKGKVVDLYSAKADYIVRYQGGNNAGHTLVVNGQKTVVHLIPSGILHPGKRNIIANGVVFDPLIFFEELESLQKSGAFKTYQPEEVIHVSERAHVILPFHRKLDQFREEHAQAGKIGTTVRGIGPAYEDKVARRGIQVIDLLRPKTLRSKLERAIEEKNILFQYFFKAEPIKLEPLYESCLKLGERLKPFVTDVRLLLQEARNLGKLILFEGAQGTLLDVDHGTYPFVTSSTTIAAGSLAGSGLGFGTNSPQSIGILKAYTTRVGTGPFPTEIEKTEPSIAEQIRKVGTEFGATTGRPRRVGWLDFVALKYAVQVNGLTGLALMKSDVMRGLKEVKVCTAYKLDGQTLSELPSAIEDLERVEPLYETLPGWRDYDTSKVKTAGDLPKEFRSYVDLIEKTLKTPVILLSIGPGREETLQLRDPFAV